MIIDAVIDLASKAVAALAVTAGARARAGAAAAPPSQPACDLFDTDACASEETCAACGGPWWTHRGACDFDEVGAEYERQYRADSGQPPITLDEEPCDACGETRAEHERRARANGYRDLADMRAKRWPEVWA